ncbi:MAG: undecaprenyl-diphosphate phosphatase [Halobacteriovoraceae bacterium]|nr:undecaprenyl-diphosphate phosphatase [Halobacteriovoraceae bacterium]
MGYFDAFVYGLVQGLSEFLPVSSSGHLALLPRLMSLKDPGVAFDLAMHVGTALAIAVYFRHEILKLINPKILHKDELGNRSKHYYLLMNYSSSTIASVLLILILRPVSVFARTPMFISLDLFVFALLMWWSDKKKDHEESHMFEIQWKKSILIGLSQALAIFPGVSRSGVTISMGRYLGLSRKESSQYSFLLSLPLIFAGMISKMPELMIQDNTITFDIILFGVFISFIVGLITLHYFLSFIRKMGLNLFVGYRILLSIIIFYVFMV